MMMDCKPEIEACYHYRYRTGVTKEKETVDSPERRVFLFWNDMEDIIRLPEGTTGLNKLYVFAIDDQEDEARLQFEHGNFGDLVIL